MNKIYFKSPTAFVVENGCTDELHIYLKKLGIAKCLIVTDPTINQLGMVEQIIEKARDQGIEFAVYADCEPEPPVGNMELALKQYQDESCQGIVGLGGGSAMDVAKAVAMLVSNGGCYQDYIGVNRVPKRCAPLILIPTTSGTGSEVSMFSIMMVDGVKAGVCDENITAHIALVNPELTASVPRNLTASTGLDAFCHLLECYISVLANSMSDMIALEGLGYVWKYLRKAVGDGQDLEARYWMSYASALGGFGPNLVDGCAANHGFAFALGAVYHLGHGLANALMLPYVFPVVARAELEKMPKLAAVLGIAADRKTNLELVDEITAAIRSLVKDVGCLKPLAEFGATPADLDRLVDEVNLQTRVMGHSSWKLSADEIREIFSSAL